MGLHFILLVHFRHSTNYLAQTWFSVYILQLGSVLRKHEVPFYFYADDSQIYLTLKHNKQKGLTDRRSWMSLNFFTLK